MNGRFPAPDLTGHYRFGQSWGYIQVGGALRYIAWDDRLEDRFDLSGHVRGGGISVSSNVKPTTTGDFRRLIDNKDCAKQLALVIVSMTFRGNEAYKFHPGISRVTPSDKMNRCDLRAPDHGHTITLAISIAPTTATPNPVARH